VVWQSYLQDGGNYGIFARALDFNDLIGDEVRLTPSRSSPSSDRAR
jgi:hypothetical protein